MTDVGIGGVILEADTMTTEERITGLAIKTQGIIIRGGVEVAVFIRGSTILVVAVGSTITTVTTTVITTVEPSVDNGLNTKAIGIIEIVDVTGVGLVIAVDRTVAVRNENLKRLRKKRIRKISMVTIVGSLSNGIRQCLKGRIVMTLLIKRLAVENLLKRIGMGRKVRLLKGVVWAVTFH